MSIEVTRCFLNGPTHGFYCSCLNENLLNGRGMSILKNTGRAEEQPVHQGSPYVYFTALKKKTKFGIWSCCCYLVTQLGPTLCDPWTATCQASLSFTSSQRLLKLMSIEPVMPSNHLILCCPLLLLPSILPSISIFSNE